MRILVVEDDRKMAALVSRALETEGLAKEVMANGTEALAAIRQGAYDLVILDIMLEGMDGLNVVRELRAAKDRTPVLLLSARGEVNERVEGLNAGADDYLPKPFAVEELLARVRALLRRNAEPAARHLRIGDLVLDTLERVVRRGPRAVGLTNREFRLLEYLMRAEGRTCTRLMILEQVWDYHFDPGTNIVEVYVRRLREKLEQPGETKLLHNVRGVGYVIREP